jgi:EAL domain-containing protein (putative c-di-GMP-specific phosphodiesterase class I)/CheY-like chemotaxis protein
MAPHCMIIEDEAGIRSIISRALSGHGITASEFGDVQGAIASLAKDQPKVIFLDVSLQDSDAIDAIRELAERKFSGAVQLISGQSAETLAEIKKIGERHGLRMCLPIAKPFTADAIYRVIAQEESLAGPALSEHPVSLRDALRNGWYELWYQPKIDLQKRTLVGAEGLARVRHPEHGLVAPKAFLTNAPQSDLVELAAVSIMTALREWSIFLESGVNLKLAVNMSAGVLAKLPVASLIRTYRPKNEGWPGLILELTEDEALEDIEAIREIATQLSLYKVSLSIDDFGSGYSSLKRLQDLPFSELKLDRCFVSNCADNAQNAKICETVISLGHEFGITVTAEGIEKTADLLALRKMGCDLGQGFLFSPAVERGDLIAAARGRPRIRVPAAT